MSMQGIFKPRVCDLPLSIRTGTGSPYDDQFVGNRLAYSYRGSDPNHRDNVGLRRAMEGRVPLVYLHAVHRARYLVVWPVFVVGDEPEALRFWVQAEADVFSLEGASLSASIQGANVLGEEARREYATRTIRQRLHQRGFRERVLDAYRKQCSMCRLKHERLLDAAHIMPDSAGGKPVVSNGLALCKIHHAAFDLGVLGVQPDDYRVHARPDVLEEIDGPMLKHGLQELHGVKLWVPRAPEKKPDPELLHWKWERFERAG